MLTGGLMQMRNGKVKPKRWILGRIRHPRQTLKHKLQPSPIPSTINQIDYNKAPQVSICGAFDLPMSGMALAMHRGKHQRNNRASHPTATHVMRSAEVLQGCR